MLTKAQRLFLTIEPGDRPRWAYRPEHRDRIDDLVAAGVLTPALGEFDFAPPDDQRRGVIVFGGTTLKISGTLLSLYQLTAHGKREMAAAAANMLA